MLFVSSSLKLNSQKILLKSTLKNPFQETGLTLLGDGLTLD